MVEPRQPTHSFSFRSKWVMMFPSRRWAQLLRSALCPELHPHYEYDGAASNNRTVQSAASCDTEESKLDPPSTINHQSSGRLGHSSTRLSTLLNNQSYELTGHSDSHLTRSLHSI
ncbi:hypothetical protein PGT21_009644 [Puccinia graminis f. sp. tritici]|uniref:Uncharacterized protein n=1 Tax=Puccinia graminis f. sp. tritici TaxID=56615 RepID=A0A5B0N4E4_PUCGR|nr:hypothetical protein PGTUg99_032936 [Puccinia graminis f. sp. tritici]KAA1094098.1 hypothetical protein PGT21_009644 [Puccinia graminis f. sp. tritici]